MIAMRIISTILLGFSCLAKIVVGIMNHDSSNDDITALSIIWGLIWRAFAITALWVI